jgi:hypothetical protein
VTLTNQPAFSDSPWFWAYLFAVAALIGLALINPKYAQRQAQLERQFEGRQGSAGAAPAPPEDERPPRITLQPLYFGLAAITVIVWLLHWRRSEKRTDVGQQKSEVG